jgi:predicted RNase H-like HicB family nuclease
MERRVGDEVEVSRIPFEIVKSAIWTEGPAMAEVVFAVSRCLETGGYIARWDDPAGGGISTQGDTFAELDEMVLDAVEGYFADREKPPSVRLHFIDDPVLVVA